MSAKTASGNWPANLDAGLERGTLLALSELNGAEKTQIAEGLDELPDPLRQACSLILASWQDLAGEERLAALVVFAEALSSLNAPGT